MWLHLEETLGLTGTWSKGILTFLLLSFFSKIMYINLELYINLEINFFKNSNCFLNALSSALKPIWYFFKNQDQVLHIINR